MIDHAIYTLITITAAALLAYTVLWSGLQTFNANPSQRFMRIWPKLVLYYAAYTMPVWALLLLIGWTQNMMPMLAQWSLPAMLFAIAVMGLYFYTVIIQPNRLRLHHQMIDFDLKTPLTLAVLADLRIGLYSGKPRHIRKLVSAINELSVDAVLITGDWLYYPGADLVGQLMLFKGVNKPIYTVMSVSDLRYQSMNTTKQGQPLLEDTLACAFDVLDITYIGQQCWSLPPTSNHIAQTHSTQMRVDNSVQSTEPLKHSKPEPRLAMLCGWQDVPESYTKESVSLIVREKQKLPASQSTKPSKYSHNKEAHNLNSEVVFAANKEALSTEIENASLPVMILASRFDNIADIPKGLQPRPLLITGAAKSAEFKSKLTQGRSTKLSQQRTNEQSAIKSTIIAYAGLDKERGLYQRSSAQVFVSSGIGTRGLPFRLRRPTIDVLTIR